MQNESTAYIAIWPGLLPASLRTYDAPTDASMKYGNVKDPLKKAERLTEAQNSWDTDASLATRSPYGFVHAIGVRLNGVNSVFVGDRGEEDRRLREAVTLARRAGVVFVLTPWTSQYLRFRGLAAGVDMHLPYVNLADRYFGAFDVPELRTLGHALRTTQHKDLLPYGTHPVSDDQVIDHLSAALLLLQHLDLVPQS